MAANDGARWRRSPPLPPLAIGQLVTSHACSFLLSTSTETMWSKLVSRMHGRGKDGRAFEGLDSKEPSDAEKVSLRLQTPLRVAKLDVKGATRTRHSLIKRLTQCIAHSSTVGEMSTSVQQALTVCSQLPFPTHSFPPTPTRSNFSLTWIWVDLCAWSRI